MTDHTELLPAAPEPASGTDGELRPRARRRRVSLRMRVLLVAGGALALVLVLVAGVLVANRLAADDLRAAQRELAAAEEAFDDAKGRVDTTATTLDELAAATDAGLAITGAGIDDAARPALQQARDAAGQVIDADGSGIVSLVGDQHVAQGRGDDRAQAAAAREQSRILADDTELVEARATRLEEAVESLASAVADYLAAAGAAGAAVLSDRSDAADDVKGTLQAQLDALSTAEPASLADTLTAYRTAVDAVVASSDAARTPATPGGTGARITDPSSLTAVVNKRRGLPADYVPPGLTTPANIPGATQVRSELIAPLEQMRIDMAAAGITLRMSSAYRSYARQQTIYNGFVASEGVAGADTHSARPGNSEHQTGLAVDLDDGAGCNLNACFANTAGGQWLAANSWKYGFILRYGDGWQPVVGYTYEPWHFRYVGVDIATDMHDRGIRTLEEYYGLPAAPDYG